MSAEIFRRLLLDALAHSDDYDGFRTRLRAGLKEAEMKDEALRNAAEALRDDMRKISPREIVERVVSQESPR